MFSNKEKGVKKLPCQTPQEAYIVQYPKAIEFADKQNSIFWTHDEIKVEKDVHDIMTNMTEAEKHGVIEVLRLFTKYELILGNEIWSTKITKMFPKPCIQRMANCFSFFELNVHAPFYNRLNEALGLNTEEFYLSYRENPILKNRMDFIDSVVESEDELLSLGVFSIVEGAILYSSFAFLKHFQSQGKNKILNVVRGINFSVRDESLHSEAGAWLYSVLKTETIEADPDFDFSPTEAKIIECAKKLYEHEEEIIEIIFAKGKIEGITKGQMRTFVKSRINLCLRQLGMKNIFKIGKNPIADYFYDSINATGFHDFFSGTGNSYSRLWAESEFVW